MIQDLISREDRFRIQPSLKLRQARQVRNDENQKEIELRVDGSSPINNKNLKAKKAGKAGGNFSAMMSGGAEEVKSSIPTNAVSSLNMLNEVDDATEAPKREVKRGHDLLDELEKIRDGLLYGGISVSRLERVKDMLSRRQEITDDPTLTEIMDEIELRAAVELAKLGRY